MVECREESKDEYAVMWRCSKCKVYMNLDFKCTKCNLRQKDNFVVKVKKAELYGNKLGHLVSSKEAN